MTIQCVWMAFTVYTNDSPTIYSNVYEWLTYNIQLRQCVWMTHVYEQCNMNQSCIWMRQRIWMKRCVWMTHLHDTMYINDYTVYMNDSRTSYNNVWLLQYVVAVCCSVLQCVIIQHISENNNDSHATRCSTPQHAAKRCNTLQHTATHCKTLQHAAVHWTHCNNTLAQNTATRSSTLNTLQQHTDTKHCNTQHTLNTLQQHIDTKHCNRGCRLAEAACYDNTETHCNTATRCNSLQHTAPHCNKLQHTSTRCNTLQHTARHCNNTWDKALE